MGVGGGIHVCCARFTQKASGKTKRLAISLNVYHESASRDIAKCDMTLLTGVACADQSSCMEDCKKKLRSSKRYNLFIQKEVLQREQDESDAIEGLKADGLKKYEAEMKDLDHAYQQELQTAQERVTKAEEAVSAARQRIEDIQRRYDELKQEVEEAPVKAEAAATEYTRTKGEFYEAKKAALDNYEAAKDAAGKRSAETLTEIDRGMHELRDKTAAREQHLAGLADDDPVPAACGGDTRKHGAFAAVQCCCSVGGVPMVVNQHFLDWGHCKSPKKYERSGLGRLDVAGLTACSPFQECATCRELVCGKGMCPQ